MLENLLFSINMNLPLFIILGLGYLLMQKGMFNDDYVARSTNLVYYVMVPAKLFLDIATMDVHAAFEAKYMAALLVCVPLQFALSWILGNLLCRDRRKQSAFSHASFRCNFVYLGMALLQNIYNTSTVPSAAAIVALVIPMYNVMGVILLSIKESRDGIHPVRIIKGILKNPMILAVLAALPFAYFGIELPYVASKSLSYLQVATSTMALLVVGANIRLDVIRQDWGLLMRVSFVKLLVMPAMFVAVALLMGVSNEQLVTMTVVGAMPAAVNVYIVTDKMGGDGQLACGAVVITHLVSLFTMTGIVFVLKTLGMI